MLQHYYFLIVEHIYISTLTNLSGFEPVNLPTLNMTRLGEDLKKNTTELQKKIE